MVSWPRLLTALLAALVNETFKVLRQKLGATGHRARRKATTGHPLLDGTGRDPEDRGDIVNGVHRLQWEITHLEDSLEQRKLNGVVIVHFVHSFVAGTADRWLAVALTVIDRQKYLCELCPFFGCYAVEADQAESRPELVA